MPIMRPLESIWTFFSWKISNRTVKLLMFKKLFIPDEMQHLHKVSDRVIINSFMGKIEFQHCIK